MTDDKTLYRVGLRGPVVRPMCELGEWRGLRICEVVESGTLQQGGRVEHFMPGTIVWVKEGDMTPEDGAE